MSAEMRRLPTPPIQQYLPGPHWRRLPERSATGMSLGRAFLEFLDVASNDAGARAEDLRRVVANELARTIERKAARSTSAWSGSIRWRWQLSAVEICQRVLAELFVRVAASGVRGMAS